MRKNQAKFNFSIRGVYEICAFRSCTSPRVSSGRPLRRGGLFNSLRHNHGMVATISFDSTFEGNSGSTRTPPQVVTGAATVIGHYTANPKLRLTIALRPPNPTQEAEFLRELQVSHPIPPVSFASELDRALFSQRADEQAVMEWATSQGFTITHRYPNRLLVDEKHQSRPSRRHSA